MKSSQKTWLGHRAREWRGILFGDGFEANTLKREGDTILVISALLAHLRGQWFFYISTIIINLHFYFYCFDVFGGETDMKNEIFWLYCRIFFFLIIKRLRCWRLWYYLILLKLRKTSHQFQSYCKGDAEVWLWCLSNSIEYWLRWGRGRGQSL